RRRGGSVSAPSPTQFPGAAGGARRAVAPRAKRRRGKRAPTNATPPGKAGRGTCLRRGNGSSVSTPTNLEVSDARDMVPVGFTLQPELAFLERLDRLIVEQADYYEVAPETLWRRGERGEFAPNGYYRRFAELGARTKKPFVAHGVGISL